MTLVAPRASRYDDRKELRRSWDAERGVVPRERNYTLLMQGDQLEIFDGPPALHGVVASDAKRVDLDGVVLHLWCVDCQMSDEDALRLARIIRERGD